MIIADTGYWLALANPRDRYHEVARTSLDSLDEALVTTWPVVTETCHLLASRLNQASVIRFMEHAAEGAFKIRDFGAYDLERIPELMRKYADLPMDLADSSLVLLAESLGHGRIFSTDQRDFQTYRWKNHKPFENLLIPYSA
ncbi:MAG: type II toxin-antitoxin system VapC family toxin [Gammaproteobacteria bacterium]